MIKANEAAAKYQEQFDTIGKAMAKAESRYKELPAEQRRVHTGRTRASNISDLYRDFMLPILADDPMIKPRFTNGVLYCLIGGECLVTFKKLNGSLRPSYMPRWYIDSITKVSPAHFSLMPDPTIMLVAGYLWDPKEPSRLYFTEPITNWFLECSEPEVVVAPDDVPSKSEAKARKVFPKKQSDNKEQNR